MNFFAKKEITEKELRRLNEFLMAKHKDAKPLSITQTHGFLCAIASTPCLIMPSKYEPVLLGGYPEFQSLKQAKEILSIISAFYNSINTELGENTSITPLLWINDNIVDYANAPINIVEEWCTGYLLAARLDPTWIADEKSLGLLAPFIELITNNTILASEPDNNNQFIDINDVPKFKQTLKKGLPNTIKEIFEYWKEARKNPKCIRGDGPPPEMLEQEKFVHHIPKIGRNDPCFCGSGIKFKKCCGSANRKMH
ncbi:MAG: UPF0149 family protein [bacterium]